MDTKILQDIGLTETEAKIYVMLLREGSSLAGVISRNTGIHRRSVYDAIERLVQKGLVSYIKTNNRKHFEAVDTKRLFEILKEKEENISKLMPELELLKKFSREKKETLFYRGKQALKSVFDDQINEGKEILIFGDAVNVNEILKWYFPKFDRQRIKKNIKVRMVFDESARKIKELKQIPLSSVRFIPKGYGSATSVYVYGSNISIVVWAEQPKAILIRESAISESFRNLFELMWRIASD